MSILSRFDKVHWHWKAYEFMKHTVLSSNYFVHSRHSYDTLNPDYV